MSNVTPLSSGSLNGQTLTIELVEPGNDLPNAVVVKWPQKPTTAAQPPSTSWQPTRCESCRMRSLN
jgi:hypothetical protein